MSMPMSCEMAQAAEKAVNPAKPSRNIRRRPKMSPSRAPAISRTAKASAVLIAVALVLNTSGHNASCIQSVGTACPFPAFGSGPGSAIG